MFFHFRFRFPAILTFGRERPPFPSLYNGSYEIAGTKDAAFCPACFRYALHGKMRTECGVRPKAAGQKPSDRLFGLGNPVLVNLSYSLQLPDNHSAEGQNADEVGNHHEAVAGVGEIPHKVQLKHRSGHNKQQHNHRVELDRLFSEEVLLR